MSISGISAGTTPVKIDQELKTLDDSKRPADLLTDRMVKQPDTSDQRIDSKISAMRQQVSGTNDNSESNAAKPSTTKPQVASQLSYAITMNDQRKSSDNSSNEKSSEDSNRQTRAESSQPVNTQNLAIQKDPIQF